MLHVFRACSLFYFKHLLKFLILHGFFHFFVKFKSSLGNGGFNGQTTIISSILSITSSRGLVCILKIY